MSGTFDRAAAVKLRRDQRGESREYVFSQPLPSSFSMKRPNSEGLFRPYTPKSVFDLGTPRLTSVRRSWGMLSLGNSAVTAVSACIVLSFFEGSESVAAKYGPTAGGDVQEITASPWWRSASLNSDTGVARLS